MAMLDPMEPPRCGSLNDIGIQPHGNLLLESQIVKYASISGNRPSCGPFQNFSDDLILEILALLGISELVALGQVCRTFLAFCRHEELWKSIALARNNAALIWRGTWRRSVLALEQSHEANIHLHNFFSDVLCTQYTDRHYETIQRAIDAQKSVESGQTRHVRSVMRFESISQNKYDDGLCKKPFIIANGAENWPALSHWNLQHFRNYLAYFTFEIETIDWNLASYIDYLLTSTDAAPLYLFDKNFASKPAIGTQIGALPQSNSLHRTDKILDGLDAVNDNLRKDIQSRADTQFLADEYNVPECFRKDWFDVFGDQKPDYRWLIIGPAGSGSTWHKDPNCSCAWNCAITGPKFWMMLPPSIMPPGVMISKDKGMIRTPLSITEYLREFLDQCMAIPEMISFIAEPADIVHVPSNWWHLVLNLEHSIAITQNFIPTAYLDAVLDFLEHRSEHVSGFAIKNPYDVLMEKLPLELRSRNGRKKRRIDWQQISNAPLESVFNF